MERPRGLGRSPFDDSAIMDDACPGDDGPAGVDAMSRTPARSPLANKTRSMSDGGTPKLSPSPHIVRVSSRTSKDDSSIEFLQQPVTPRRTDLSRKGLSLHMPPRDFTPPPPAAAASSSAYVKPAPLSPKLDHSQIYASPTNILPRRSRGLDFSRAATSLHHSTLAEQSSPDSSPTIGGRRAMSIPSRRGDYGGLEQTSTSLWGMMGNQEKMNISSSLGSTHAVGSDSASSSDYEDLMDEDTEDAYVSTPQVSKRSSMGQPGPFGSPAMSSLASFQQRQRPRRQPKKKMRGPLGLGFSSTNASLSRSPPSNSTQTRRESISWQANQLHISGADTEENARVMNDIDGITGDGQRNVIRRVVTRRGNLLPKTKTFARIRAALAEEGAPAEAECAREAEVVKQVREGEPDLDIRMPASGQEGSTTALSSPNLAPHQDALDDVPESDIMADLTMGLSSSFKQQAIKNSKGKSFWDNFSETGSMGGARTPPPPPAFLPRGSSSGISEDVAMDSPSLAYPPGFPTALPSHSRAESLRSEPHTGPHTGPQPPSAAEITRRINTKRRRGDDEFDPVSFKRRAVSPGMSVHNSPVMQQSPMQRDSTQWGSRPGSNGGDKGGSSAPSESGSGTPGNVSGSSGSRVANSKVRVGFQGMVDTNDGIMRMSIE